MANELESLASIIAGGLPAPDGGIRKQLESLFGTRYYQRHFQSSGIRDAYGLSSVDQDEGVPFAGLINPDNPPSGPYGGASIVWFPTKADGSLLCWVVGTRGLSPDEGILTRPGHRRRIKALRRYLNRIGIEAWTKPDPGNLNEPIPKSVSERLAAYKGAIKKYGREIYCAAPIIDRETATSAVQSYFDLYAYERGWQPLKSAEHEFNLAQDRLRSDLFQKHTAENVYELLLNRRFVVLQGPPGTGKTRMADEVCRKHFLKNGMTVQFHPAVTYEDFVIGLSPDPSEQTLRFKVRPGWLLDAIKKATQEPFLLIIDEVNRADLGKVLGEAIYLFEPGEIGGENARTVELAHPVNGQKFLALPENLYVLATMNTADRSIAGMDLAVRRRFAFVDMPPDRSVVTAQDLCLATSIFDQLVDIFVEHAPDESMDLIPGHAYFLARNEDELKQRFRYELLPLLDEYLREGMMGTATSELHAVRDKIEDVLQNGS